MDKSIHQRFSPSILEAAQAAYGLSTTETQALDGFESFIFSVCKGQAEYILRIGHDSRRTAAMVRGEAEFLNYLQGGGLSVPQVLQTGAGELVASLADGHGGNFITTLFTKAPGKPPLRDDWNPLFFERMGQFLGRLHSLSRRYVPSSAQHTRFAIQQDFAEMEATALAWLPAGDAPLLAAYRELTQAISALPKHAGSYGLCHADFHRGNFFVDDDGDICLFDFDDCQYAWYVYDIAMALFYAIPPHCSSQEQLDEARTFLTHFWHAYRLENDLDAAWLLEIPKFLRLREIDLYIAIHRSMDINDLDPWCAMYMHGRREKILDGVPFCAIDYSTIA